MSEEQEQPAVAESIEAPVIRKRGRPKRVDFKPVPSTSKDEITLLKEELARVQSQMAAIRHRNTIEAPLVVESPAFKGRPLPHPLPEGFPEVDPLAGDKTPAVVEWFRDNDPEEFEERYRGRRTHLLPRSPAKKREYVLDEETGRRIKEMARAEGKVDLNMSPRQYGG